MGNISTFIMHSRSTVGYRTIKNSDLAYTLRLLMGIELEVFWIGIKE